MYKTILNPTRFTWDFWYYYDQAQQIFHLFYLNANPGLVSTEQHHFHSQVGYATTKDFKSIQWGPDDVLTASEERWDNSSIWTGDVVRISNGFLMFYTSRNLETDDGKTQNIGVAYADRIDAAKWEPLTDFRLQPADSYLIRGIKDDVTIHAWRDPFLFQYNGNYYMLVSAKTSEKPIGKNGVVGLLKSTNGSFKNWDYCPPVAMPGYYSEMEVSQLLKNSNGKYELAFSTGPDYDTTPETKSQGGLYTIDSENPLSFQNKPVLLNSFQDGLYACRVIPELDNVVVGFDHHTGGLRRADIKSHYLPINKEFLNWNV